MKASTKLLLGGVSALALLSGGATVQAADMAVKAAPFVPAPVFSWTGCYAGGHLGYASGTARQQSFSSGSPTEFGSWDGDMSGGLGGLQLGCNYQFDRSWVIGVEGSYSLTDIKATLNDHYYPSYNYSNGQAKLSKMFSVTGRIGYTGLNPNLLLYVKGGYYSARQQIQTNLSTYSYFTSTRNVSGWGIGGGFEAVISGPWTFFVDYQHVSLRKNNNAWHNFSSSLDTCSTYCGKVKYNLGLPTREGEPIPESAS